ncbi:MAG: hypothetical protein JNL80_12555 [Phycisphaerae bacterium]|jgi:hypothetical protein|nr:hypothetical protein [Phycisphaerae bacterium]
MRTLIRLLVIALAALVVQRGVGGSPPNDPPKAIDSYAKAFDWWKAQATGDQPSISARELEILGSELEGAPTAEVRAALAKVQPYLDLVRAGGRTAEYGLELDRSQGFGLLMPHLQALRNAARVLRLDAEVRLADGDARGATDSLLAITGFATHARQDAVLISSLVSGALLTLNDAAIDRAMSVGALDAERAGQLADALAALRGPDPLAITDAVKSEAGLVRASLEQWLKDGEPIEALVGAAPGSINANELTPERVDADVTTLEKMYGEAAEAASNPDREAGRAALAALEARAANGEAGLLGRLLMPSLLRCADSSWRVSDMLDKRWEMLNAIRLGKASPMKFANAAFAYLRIAALMDTLGRDEQEAMEAARLAGAALDPEARQRARRTLASLRGRLREAFAEAAERERCDFSVSREPRPSLIASYLPGLRGGLRALGADAALGPDEAQASGTEADSHETAPSSDRNLVPSGASRQPPFVEEEAVAASLRAARHLAMDPGIGHSVFAASILSEAAANLSDATAAGRLDAAAIVRLRAVAVTVDRGDPAGFTKSMEADRELAAARLTVNGDRDKAMVLNTLKKRGDGFTYFLLLEQVRVASPHEDASDEAIAASMARWRDLAMHHAPLLGVGDLVPHKIAVDACNRIVSRLRPADPAKPDSRDWYEYVTSFSWTQAIDLAAWREAASDALGVMDKLLPKPEENRLGPSEGAAAPTQAPKEAAP